MTHGSIFPKVVTVFDSFISHWNKILTSWVEKTPAKTLLKQSQSRKLNEHHSNCFFDCTKISWKPNIIMSGFLFPCQFTCHWAGRQHCSLSKWRMNWVYQRSKTQYKIDLGGETATKSNKAYEFTGNVQLMDQCCSRGDEVCGRDLTAKNYPCAHTFTYSVWRPGKYWLSLVSVVYHDLTGFCQRMRIFVSKRELPMSSGKPAELSLNVCVFYREPAFGSFSVCQWEIYIQQKTSQPISQANARRRNASYNEWKHNEWLLQNESSSTHRPGVLSTHWQTIPTLGNGAMILPRKTL